MIATLPMYDRPETAAANDRLWGLIHKYLGFGPEKLTRPTDPWAAWQDPELVLAQTCGLPFRSRLHGSVQLVGTPDYGLDDCPPGYYRSAIVVHQDNPVNSLADLTNARLAFNDPLSQSGWAALVNEIPEDFRFGACLRSGSHAQSAKMVITGQADFAALDAVTLRLLNRYEPEASQLRILAWTRPTPGLPFITGPAGNPDQIYEAVLASLRDLSSEDRAILGIRTLVRIPKADYLSVPTPPPPAQ